MRKPWIICGLSLFSLFAYSRLIKSQTNAQTSADVAQSVASYNLRVSVDEVSLTFHAADAHGLPVNDLKLDELSLLDNGKPPRGVLAFQSFHDFPIRAGILMDMSQSMEEARFNERAIAIQYAQKLLRQQTDRAFVIKFDRLSQIAQPWTGDANALTAGIRNHVHLADSGSHLTGTAIFDAVYAACLNQFSHIENATSGNFILLFSDGEDNASHASLQQAVDICQHANTAIYAFRPEPKSTFSPGPKTLADLTSQTGGRVFFDDDSEAGIDNDLRAIEADLRNQYRLVYKPAGLKHDGSFHRVQLTAPERADSITVRSGYYAPTH